MSALPRRVDARRLAASRGALAGEVELARLPRLADALLQSHPSGAARLALAFAEDGQRRATATGHVQATLCLQCQRCLGPMELAVSNPLRLVFVAGEDAAADVPRDRDPVVLAPDGGLDPVALVEDELILALPVVARHEQTCGNGAPARHDSADDEARAPGRESPFAVLRHADNKHGE